MGRHADLAGADLHAPSFQKITNESGSSMPIFTVVKPVSTVGNFTGADFADTNADPVLGITTSALLPAESGTVFSYGLFQNINTSAWLAGDVLYADAVTSVLTTSANGPKIALVVKSDAVNGILYVYNTVDPGLATGLNINALPEKVSPVAADVLVIEDSAAAFAQRKVTFSNFQGTMQSVYTNSSDPEITLDPTRGAVTIRDAATPIGANLFEVQSDGGASTYFRIDATGATVGGTLVVTGDLTVNGTTTTINSTTVTVDDKNIELGSVDVPTDITANGGGITLKGDTDKTIIWDNATDAWRLNQNLDVTGNITVSGTVDGRDLQADGVILDSLQTIDTVSTNTLLNSTNGTVLVSAAAADVTLTLPTAVGISGRRYTIKKIDSSLNTVTIDASGSETIDGNLLIETNLKNTAITVQSDGSNWWII